MLSFYDVTGGIQYAALRRLTRTKRDGDKREPLRERDSAIFAPPLLCFAVGR